MPGRGADDAGAGAEEPGRAGGAGGGGGGRERQGGAAGDRRRSRARRRAPVSPLAALLASDKAAVDDRARAARVLGALDDARAGGGAGGRAGARAGAACGRRWSARSAQAPQAARRRRCWRRSRPGRTTAARARRDLLRALPAVVKRDPERRAEAIGSLRAALAPERSFEVRGARGDGARDAGRARAIPARWRSCASTATSRCCVTWRRASWRPDAGGRPSIARPALRGALDDQDPRVRETAALALGKQGDTESAPALIAGAKQEPWPFVRRAELRGAGPPVRAGRGRSDAARDRARRRRGAPGRAGRAGPLQGHARADRAAARRRARERGGDRARAGGGAARRIGRQAARRRSWRPRCAAWSTRRRATWRWRASRRPRCAPSPAWAAPTPSARRSRWPATSATPIASTAVDALGTLCDPVAGRATLRALAAGREPSLAVAAQNAEKHCGWR